MVEVVKSPLTGLTNVKLEKVINSQDIVQLYLDRLQIDVQGLFNQIPNVYIYKCLDSGFRFYYPFNIDGEGALYEALQQLPWYYTEWKWDFEIAAQQVNKISTVLEIGCGDGKFLSYLTNRGISCRGLELNEKAVSVGKSKGIDIANESVQEHAVNHSGHYNIVCLFQVLEHISDIKSFLQATIDLLAPGGKLIISVPNNQSILKYDDNNPFNKPPHHMGLWDKNSLENLATIFNLKVEKFFYEPLIESDFGWYYSILVGRIYALHWRLGTLFKKVPISFVSSVSKITGRYIHGHSIMAVYSK